MIIGKWKIETCRECPAYEWEGESTYRGDHGMRCGFGVFSNEYGTPTSIHPDCPIKNSARPHYNTQCETCGHAEYGLIDADDYTECTVCGSKEILIDEEYDEDN